MLFRLFNPLKEAKEVKEEIVVTLKFPPMACRFSSPSKDSRAVRELFFLASISKFPPMVCRFSSPSKDSRAEREEEEKEEEEVFISKSPPMLFRLFNPSKETMLPSVMRRFSVIFARLYRPSNEVNERHSKVREPSISVSRLSNFCKVFSSLPRTMMLPWMRVCPAALKSSRSCSVSQMMSARSIGWRMVMVSERVLFLSLTAILAERSASPVLASMRKVSRSVRRARVVMRLTHEAASPGICTS